jgi:FlaG/FlaF family flagellin (archaellin)
MVSAFAWMSKRASRAGAPLAAALALAAIAAGGAAVPASAVAGQYHVYSCRTPAGESAPADGWSGSNVGPETFVQDTCAEPGGALMAALGAERSRTANADSATWTFSAPMGETLTGATLWRAGDADGGGALNAFYTFLFSGPGDLATPTSTFGACVGGTKCPNGLGTANEPLAQVNQLVVPAVNLGPHLYFGAICGGLAEYSCPNNAGDSNGYAAVVYVYAADMILEQPVGPTATNVSGELATAPTVAGTTDVAFSATDPGSGVYEAVFTVDGQVVQRNVLDENNGRCKNVGQTTDGLPAFVYVQPCLPSVSADVGLDTTKVSNGTHHLVVSVTDAAGNAATVLDRTITIDNPAPPGAPNGTNASARATMALAWKGSSKSRLTTGYGHRETVVGRLTDPGGVPIAGAQIDVLATRAYAGARVAAVASPTTGPDGRFTVQIPAGVSSRSLRFEYSSTIGSSPAVTETLTLSVRAGVTLQIAPRVSSVGRSIHFSGRLRGGPVPRGGKLLVLEARSPGGTWLEFDVVRSDARGVYRASYRFKFPGPANYQFRVVCEAEADYPFATGSSRVVGVFER